MKRTSCKIYTLLKRSLDIVVSLIIIILFSPLLFAVAFLALVFMGRPILFKHKRPGLHGVPFDMIKFRTMRLSTPGGSEVQHESRITPFGRFMRSTSLDELPSLWSVLKGDMSLVGPRPLLMEYLDLYTDEQRRRHDVRPGVTGWAQVNGRNAISWSEKFERDIWYVDNCSFSLDTRILLLTAKKVLAREDISPIGADEMSPFRGVSKK